jgi:hypothetical protein
MQTWPCGPEAKPVHSRFKTGRLIINTQSSPESLKPLAPGKPRMQHSRAGTGEKIIKSKRIYNIKLKHYKFYQKNGRLINPAI